MNQETHQPEPRAADADRERVAERLRSALHEGRLDLAEFDTRLQAVYAAKTYADLAPITADLPAAAPTSVVSDHQPHTAAHHQPWYQRYPVTAALGSWISVSLMCTAIWAATSISSGHPDSFWPIWVILPMGAVTLPQLIRRIPQQDHSDNRR